MRARQDVGDGALGNRQAEHLVEQPGEPLEADRVDGVQIDHQRLDRPAERRARFEAWFGGGGEPAGAARAGAAEQMDAGDVGPDLGNFDAVIDRA